MFWVDIFLLIFIVLVDMGMNEFFLVLGFCCILVGLGIIGIVILFVELLLEFLKLLRVVFFFFIKYVLVGEFLGDLYVFGIVGIGGIFLLLLLCKGLCIVVSFGVGNFEVEVDIGSWG